jgi:uncharacterized membrane protein YgcG
MIEEIISNSKIEILLGLFFLFAGSSLVATICMLLIRSSLAVLQWTLLTICWIVWLLGRYPQNPKWMILGGVVIFSLLAMGCGVWSFVRLRRNRTAAETTLAVSVISAATSNVMLVVLDWIVSGNWGIA